MATSGFVLLFGGFVVLVAIIAYFSWLAAKKRREAFAALAAARGWSYTQRDDRWAGAFNGAPFDSGHNRQASNILRGEFDTRGFVAFDYVYYTTETSTDSEGRTTSREVAHRYSVVGLEVGASFPPLAVSPEGMFSRMVGRLTNRDIELESEDFNRAFTVTCPDRKFASDVLHPRMMEFLLTHPDSSFRFDGAWVLSVDNRRVDLEDVEPRLHHLDTIVDNVPEFVWREVRGG